MKKLLKCKVLIMIVLFSCFINLSESKSYSITSSTGVVDSNDSVLIAYDDLRIANSKMIELKYEKEKNNLLQFQVQLDSILLQSKDEVIKEVQDNKKEVVKQRNIVAISAGTFLVALLTLLIVK